MTAAQISSSLLPKITLPWAAVIDGFLTRLHGESPSAQPYRVTGAPRRMAVDDGRIWILTSDRRELVALDVRRGEQIVSVLRGEPVDVAADDGEAWAVTGVDDRLWRAADTGL